MDFFSRGKTVSLPKQLREQLAKLDGQAGASRDDQLVKNTAQVLQQLETTPNPDPRRDHVLSLINELNEEDLLYLFALHLHQMPMQARKDAQRIFTCVFRYRPASLQEQEVSPGLRWTIRHRPNVFVQLCKCLNHEASAVAAGTVLRDILGGTKGVRCGHEGCEVPVCRFLTPKEVAAIILYEDGDGPGSSLNGVSRVDPSRQQSGNGVFWQFFRWIDQTSLIAGQDAFLTFSDLLTVHKSVAAQYLGTNFERFCDTFHASLLDPSSLYTTQRQCWLLLSKVLLDKKSGELRSKFTQKIEYLKFSMNALSSQQHGVRFGGFEVFKIFMANPGRPAAVQRILIKNRDQLLNKFEDEKFLMQYPRYAEDTQFTDEMATIMKWLRELPSQPPPASY